MNVLKEKKQKITLLLKFTNDSSIIHGLLDSSSENGYFQKAPTHSKVIESFSLSIMTLKRKETTFQENC